MKNMTIDRQEVEDFLYAEADLLDSWQLKEWFALFTDDCRYLVPAAGLTAEATPQNSLYYIADDHVLLDERVKRLYKRNAHAEQPHSKTRHFITNVRLHPAELADEIAVSCAFLVHRNRSGQTCTFVGRSTYRLVLRDGAMMIREKLCRLDSDDLFKQGRISILL